MDNILITLKEIPIISSLIMFILGIIVDKLHALSGWKRSFPVIHTYPLFGEEDLKLYKNTLENVSSFVEIEFVEHQVDDKSNTKTETSLKFSIIENYDCIKEKLKAGPMVLLLFLNLSEERLVMNHIFDAKGSIKTLDGKIVSKDDNWGIVCKKEHMPKCIQCECLNRKILYDFSSMGAYKVLPKIKDRVKSQNRL